MNSSACSTDSIIHPRLTGPDEGSVLNYGKGDAHLCVLAGGTLQHTSSFNFANGDPFLQ